MLRFIKVLEAALNELFEAEGVLPEEVHDVELERDFFGRWEQWAIYFPEWKYWCFSIAGSDSFFGYREDAA